MKILNWNCCGVGNPTTVHELKQLLVANAPDIVFICETKIGSNGFLRIRNMCRMEGCLAISLEGKSGGLALFMDDGEVLRFTGFYGQTDPSLRQQSWDMLRRVKSKVNEGWTTLMDEFCDILEELNLTDVKTCNGWFTWTNNRDGNRLQAQRGEDNNRVWFRYDTCWAKEQEFKDIITSIWYKEDRNMLEKIELTRDNMGPWQYQYYRRLKYKIKGLEKEISKLMDGPTNERSMSLLKQARSKLGHFYDWLREGDRNTCYFYIRASGRIKKE
ncbi:hypothetical protein ES288_A08G113700v1 [Gossypium darwinii]|uniref:Endonuclease/exonuclease/phosphatase domain-containing protein n=1 Tax=Gossypium darwinii TaxID=34276 RepID=A0A5D2FIU7_GOSDA|nr:hypothetical protein ES288_A08G113700v1 [Gossypium darwinii]